jgi:hypothetical protein
LCSNHGHFIVAALLLCSAQRMRQITLYAIRPAPLCPPFHHPSRAATPIFFSNAGPHSTFKPAAAAFTLYVEVPMRNTHAKRTHARPSSPSLRTGLRYRARGLHCCAANALRFASWPAEAASRGENLHPGQDPCPVLMRRGEGASRDLGDVMARLWDRL